MNNKQILDYFLEKNSIVYDLLLDIQELNIAEYLTACNIVDIIKKNFGNNLSKIEIFYIFIFIQNEKKRIS